MGVFCFAALKGGVGKTSLSINVSAAFAKRGCETLLIDLDPVGHSSRFFKNNFQSPKSGSPLATLFLSEKNPVESENQRSVIEAADDSDSPLWYRVRPNLQLIPSGKELRHFLWGRGARRFHVSFGDLIEEAQSIFDHVVIDTPPEYNVLTRNALAVADIACVPVDSSEMSIHCLEELIDTSGHIARPTWVIVRSLVTRAAKRVQELSTSAIFSLLNESSDNEDFLKLLRLREKNGTRASKTSRYTATSNQKPIYLLNSLVYRTEMQNRLSFLGKTAFDDATAATLGEQYFSVARELEEVIATTRPTEETTGSFDKLISSTIGLS